MAIITTVEFRASFVRLAVDSISSGILCARVMRVVVRFRNGAIGMLGIMLVGRFVAGNGGRRTATNPVHRVSIGLVGGGYLRRDGLARNSGIFGEPDRQLLGCASLAVLWNRAGALEPVVDGGENRSAIKRKSAGALGSGLAGGGSLGSR